MSKNHVNLVGFYCIKDGILCEHNLSDATGFVRGLVCHSKEICHKGNKYSRHVSECSEKEKHE